MLARRPRSWPTEFFSSLSPLIQFFRLLPNAKIEQQLQPTFGGSPCNLPTLPPPNLPPGTGLCIPAAVSSACSLQNFVTTSKTPGGFTKCLYYLCDPSVFFLALQLISSFPLPPLVTASHLHKLPAAPVNTLAKQDNEAGNTQPSHSLKIQRGNQRTKHLPDKDKSRNQHPDL